MKALLLSDIHTSYRLLSSIYEKFNHDRNIGCTIFCGDLVDMGEPVSFVDEFLWTIGQLGHTLLWVPGNNDFGRSYHRLNARIKSVEGKIVEFGGRKFTGVGGSPASWSGQYEGERSVDKKAIAGTIFLSHVPPPGLNHFEKFDQSPGRPANSSFGSGMEDPKMMKAPGRSSFRLADAPLLHICGHIHHTWGIGRLGSTKVVKLAGSYLGYIAVLDLENLEVNFENIFR